MPDLEIPAGFGACTVIVGVAGRTKPFTTSFGYNLPAGAEVDNTILLNTCLIGSDHPFDHANMATAYTYLGISVRQQGDVAQYAFDFPQSITGTQSILPPSSNCSILVKKTSGIVGKKNRGRMYVPPFNVTEADIDPRGIVTPAERDAMQVFYSNMLDDLAAADLNMVILHHGAGAPTPVTQLLVEGLLATQRRRMR